MAKSGHVEEVMLQDLQGEEGPHTRGVVVFADTGIEGLQELAGRHPP